MGSEPFSQQGVAAPDKTLGEKGSDPNFVSPWPDFNAIPTDQYGDQRETLGRAYRAVRQHSQVLTRCFSEAEQQIQSMPDASPSKWHLAHTTWFFETFLLQSFQSGFEWFDERFCYLFNSYYNAVGSQYPRPQRGLITDPDLAGIWQYREQIDGKLVELLDRCDDGTFEELAPILVLGLNHEQQHQELIRTDIKHALYQPAALPQMTETAGNSESASGVGWVDFEGGKVEIGYAGEGFCFDNELSRHEVLLPPFRLSRSPVTSGEWLEFMDDGGYANPLLWLSDGWHWRRKNGIQAPHYWRKIGGLWHYFTIYCRSGASAAKSGRGASPQTVGAAPRRDPAGGWAPIDPGEPVLHISYYEADAFAAWCGARLPREAEWEAAVNSDHEGELGNRGKSWEWTQSAYLAYPGFRPTEGMAGEYNGKFMVNQMVLRGGSPATAAYHSRPSYRNFFYPHARWQYSGLRLAHDRGEARHPGSRKRLSGTLPQVPRNE